MRFANAFMHGLHLAVILFCALGWILPETRAWHLGLCALIYFSWFVLGPLTGELGFCFLTGIQQKLWKKQGREIDASYMVFLYEKLLQRPAPQPLVSYVTQGVLYSTTLLSLCL